MKRLLVIQHDHVSPPGPIAERFADHGYTVELHNVVPEDSYASPGVQASFPNFTTYDAVVPMGAPWSTYDAGLIGSWVAPELGQLRAADTAGVPVLGICFGGQLLATAHGGTVTASSTPEVGWADIDSDEEAIVPSGRWFQWHYDAWALPPGAVELARNPAASQAFILRRNLAVQFHPELTSVTLRAWLGNGGEAEVRALGLDSGKLLDQATTWDPEGRRRAHELVDGFLRVTALGAQNHSAAPAPLNPEEGATTGHPRDAAGTPAPPRRDSGSTGDRVT